MGIRYLCPDCRKPFDVPESLARFEIPVEPDRPTVLRLRLARSDGDVRPLNDRQLAFPELAAMGRAAGFSPDRPPFVLEFLAGEDDQPIWRRALRTGPHEFAGKSLAEPEDRSSLKTALGRAVDEVALPCCIRSCEDLLIVLPAVLDDAP